MIMKNFIKTLFFVIGIFATYFPSVAQITEFRSWGDVSYLLGEKATFYGKIRWTSGTISLVSDGEKYWLYIQDVKFLPVHTGELSRNTAGLGVMDGGKPIPFTLHVSSSEKPYITFDSRRTENIFVRGDYGWEYYEPDILNGKPLIRAHTYDKYNGESSRPEAAKFYMVDAKSGFNSNAQSNNGENTSKRSYTANDFQGKTFSGSGNEAHCGYDLTISFLNDGKCICASENGADVGWQRESVIGTYSVNGDKLSVKCSEASYTFEIQNNGTKLYFDESESQAMPNYMTIELQTAESSNTKVEKIEPYNHPTIAKNKKGQKLVESIEESWVDWTGDIITNYCHTYNFVYDGDGNLYSISKSSKEDSHSYKETITLNDGQFSFSLAKDGKEENFRRVEFLTDYTKHGIKGRATFDKAKEDGFDYYFCNIFSYSPTIILRMDGDGFGSIHDFINDARNNGAKSTSLWTKLDLGQINHPYLIDASTFGSLGIKKGIHYYMTEEDSIMYMVDSYELQEYAYRHGNPVERPRDNLDEYKNEYMYKIEYTDKINDTNLNLLPLSNTMTLNSYYRNIECLTEWFPIRSKNLPLYEDRWGNRYETKWDYEFDDDGNLIKIILDAEKGGRSTGTFKLSYVKK